MLNLAPDNKPELKISKHLPLVGAALFIIVAGLLAIRITIGVDFGDEAYYAFFITDWLNNGIDNSTLITLHQTAALNVYPLASLYKILNGGTDGLFLFLRSIFLFLNIVAAICWMIFLRFAGYGLLMWLGGIFILSFIPFGLPAPSYNTLGSQALIIALAMLGCGMLTHRQSIKSKLSWLALSTLFLTIATIAYPSLLIATFFIIGLGIFHGAKTNPYTWAYVGFLIILLFSGWGSVIYALSFDKLYNSILYLSLLNEPLNYLTKLNFIVGLFIHNLLFSVLCLCAMMIGLLRKYLNTYVLMLSISTLLIGLLFTRPVLFVRSHDAITLLALTGLGLLFDLRKKASLEARTIALVYAFSLIAACITGTTALHSIFNFCIGAVPAAFLAILPSPTALRALKYKSICVLPATIAIFILLSTSLFFYYGEIPSSQARSRISSGIYKGISAREDDIVLLNIVKKEISPLLAKNPSLAIFARSPGIVLGEPVRIKMPFVYPLLPPVSEKGLTATRSFYEKSANRPAIVLVYRDPYLELINPMQGLFNDWYKPLSHVKTPLGELSIFVARK